jgi:hypothetical protein
MTRQPIIDKDTGQVFSVEEVEPGQFQSVFPTRFSDCSCLHDSEKDAWEYIDSVIRDVAHDNSQFGVGA